MDLQKEWQLDVSELGIAARTAAAWHIKTMVARSEKIIAKISKVNQKAANAIGKIPPSAHVMFGGDAAELEKVVKLAKDLGGTTMARQPFQCTTSTTYNYNNKRGGGFTPRSGGFNNKGGGFKSTRGRGAKNFTRGN